MKAFFYTVKSLSVWISALFWTIAHIFLGKNSLLSGIAFGSSMILGHFVLSFIFGIPKRNKPCKPEQTQASSSLYDDIDVCGRKVNLGLMQEHNYKFKDLH